MKNILLCFIYKNEDEQSIEEPTENNQTTFGYHIPHLLSNTDQSDTGSLSVELVYSSHRAVH